MNRSALSRSDLVTTWGVVRLFARDGVLVHCALPVRHTARAVAPRLLRCALRAATPADRRVLRQAGTFVRVCLAGRVPAVLPPLQSVVRGRFTACVLAALRRIPRGVTATYGEIARRLGVPHAARAVGAACGANPLPLFIPCHRVVAAGGALGGFSAGRAWKRFLLANERA